MNEILVCNCGSSSVKIDIFSIKSNRPEFVAAVSAGRVGKPECNIQIKVPGKDTVKVETANLDHEAVIHKISELLQKNKLFLKENRLAVGHRIVHGAHYIKDPVVLTNENLGIVKKCIDYAPLHNPVNLKGIKACTEIFQVPQTGVFDTAFHHTMPAKASTYALPEELTLKHNIKRYGFHGTSHEYVAREAARILETPFDTFKCITLHLGNGASACAISHGKSVDTSMGFTPLEGLVMGTRCGDLDPALVGIISQKEGLSFDEIDLLLNKKSGLMGICNQSDMRDIINAANDGNVKSQLARDVFSYRVKKYIGSYLAILNGADAIIFTGGIGENSSEIRELCLHELDGLGINIDMKLNQNPANNNGKIHSQISSTQILVIPTDEEWMIANKTLELSKSF